MTTSAMPTQPDPRVIVADGYDRIAERYAQWVSHDVVDEPRQRYVTRLLERLPQGAAVLELGCGGGRSTTRQLAERFVLTGVDISARQIALARRHVPGATFLHTDMSRLELPAASFDGVIALYSLTHLPYGELPALLGRLGWWLRPGGLLLATMSAGSDPGTVEPDWLGAPMFFSGYAIDDNRRFVQEAGLEIESAQVETILEEERQVAFLWMVATKRVSAPGAQNPAGVARPDGPREQVPLNPSLDV